MTIGDAITMPDAPPGADKAALRRLMRARTAALGARARARASAACCEHLARCLHGHARVAAYVPTGTELDVRPLVGMLWARGVTVLVPGVGQTPEAPPVLRPWAPDAPLVSNAWGVGEPVDAPAAAFTDVGAVLVPGLAFAADGARLGRGGGHYDRLLAQGSARRIGVAFGCQLAASIPMEPHDVFMHAWASEDGVFACHDVVAQRRP